MIWESNRLLIAAAATLLCATSAVPQENQGTPEQRAACTSDAFRLCSSYIPDATKVETCLRQNKSSLSNACRSVFDQAPARSPAEAEAGCSRAASPGDLALARQRQSGPGCQRRIVPVSL
jgi:hypothetical protein